MEIVPVYEILFGTPKMKGGWVHLLIFYLQQPGFDAENVNTGSNVDGAFSFAYSLNSAVIR